MKHVLLVGKFTPYLREAQKVLSSTYEVRTCVNKLEIFDGMYKIKKPDAIMLLVEQREDSDEELLEALRKEYKEVPVVCFHSDVDDDWIKDYVKSQRFVYLPSNTTMDKLTGIIADAIKKNEGGECEAQKVGGPSTSGKKTLLLVDDSGFALRTIKSLIGDKYNVRMVTSGLDAITVIHQKKPDLILLDYQMPMFDGKQTMEKIKEIEWAQDIPIVFVTSVNDRDHIKAVLELKPAGYLLKPVDGDRLIQTIESIIGK